MFTEENSTTLPSPSTIDIRKITVNGESIDYTLENDTLELSLINEVVPQKETNVDISYSFTLPKEGFRFTQNGLSFYLAHWYPMVPTYRNGWNKEEFQFRGESYHTTYTDFKIEYDIPSNYTVVTSSEKDKFPSENKYQLLYTFPYIECRKTVLCV